MKTDALKKMVSFMFRYLWILCVILICIDSIGNFYCAKELILSTSHDALSAVQGEIETKIATTISFLEGAADSEVIQDDSLTLQERAKSLEAYANSMNMVLLGVIDKDGLGSCTFNYEPISFSETPYFQLLKETGKPVVTDVNFSDIYGVRNFTIAVPVKNPDCSAAAVAATINFDEIDKIINRKIFTDSIHYLIVDKNQLVTANPNPELVGKSLSELDKKSFYLTSSTEEFYDNISSCRDGRHIAIYNKVIYYTPYSKIANTDWYLILRMDMAKTLRSVAILSLVKILLYILIFLFISIVGNKYILSRLKPVSNVIDQVEKLNDDIRKLDYGKRVNINLSEMIETSYQGLRDELTGMPTRTLFQKFLKSQLGTISLSLYTAIYYIDMDNLKEINDSFGHQFGDSALVYFGEQLSSIAREYNCYACRYGGDEFLLLAQNFKSVEELEQLAKIIISRLNTVIMSDGKSSEIHASAGVAVYPVNSQDMDEIVQLADKALYYSKQNCKGGYTFYTPGQ